MKNIKKEKLFLVGFTIFHDNTELIHSLHRVIRSTKNRQNFENMDDTKIDYGIFMYKIVQKVLRKLYIKVYKHFNRVIFKAHVYK